MPDQAPPVGERCFRVIYTSMCWERVVTIDDFYDGPRSGVALLDGRPHVFQSVFDEVEDEYSEEFDLAPIDETLLPLIEEARRISTKAC